MMTPHDFRARNTERNANAHHTPRPWNLALYGMGLSGEAGEVTDELKKHLFHGKPLDPITILTEAGDVLWYLDRLLLALGGYTLGDAMHQVTAKLDARYPNGFVPHLERTDL